jgi:hypothetical protein
LLVKFNFTIDLAIIANKILKRMRPVLLGMIIFFTLLLQNVFAQLDQVAFAPGIFEITAEMQKDLKVLEPYSKDFQSAMLLRDEQGQYFLQVTKVANRQQFTETYPFSQDDLMALRQQLAEKNITTRRNDDQQNQGRLYLVTSSTLNSIPQGILISYAISPGFGNRTNFSRAFPFFLSAGVFTSTLLLSKDKNIRSSSANMHLFGSSIGFSHGFLTNLLLFGDENFATRKRLLVTSGVSIAEGWGLYYLSQKNDFDYSRSMAWNTGNFWGTGSGLMLYILVAGDNDVGQRGFAASGLLGAVGGIALMDVLHKRHFRTPGDYRAMNALAITGYVFGAGTAININSSRGIAAAFLSGITLGMGVGYARTANTSFTKLEGGLIALGTFTGGLLGGAVSILAAPDNESTAIYLTAAGGAIGWVATYSYFLNQERPIGAIGFKGDNGRSFNLSVNPMGFTLGKRINQYVATQSTSYIYGAETIRLNMSF